NDNWWITYLEGALSYEAEHLPRDIGYARRLLFRQTPVALGGLQRPRLKEAHPSASKKADASLRKIAAHASQGSKEEAKAALENFVYEHRGHQAAWRLLTQLALDLSDHKTAYKAALKTLSLRSNVTSDYCALASALFESNLAYEAAEILLQILRFDPARPTVWAMLSSHYQRTLQWKEAEICTVSARD